MMWNVILTALVTALIGLLGWVLVHMNQLEQLEASRAATEFKIQDAMKLQQDLTKIMTDIDMRIRLIERDIQWIKNDGYGGMAALRTEMYVPKTGEEEEGVDVGGFGGPIPPAPEPDPTPEPPRYQLDSIKE